MPADGILCSAVQYSAVIVRGTEEEVGDRAGGTSRPL